jgi:starvation-inducible DNA-binding protein
MTKQKVRIGLNDSAREGVAKILARTLADEVVLGAKTRNYHWNVSGPHFHDLHKFFEAQYGQLEEAIDDTAERIRALGEPAPGTLKEFLALTRLQEHTSDNAQGMIADLLEAHETLITHLRKDLDTCADKFKDAGNQDFLTGLMEQHEKMAWMLRSMLE